MTTSAEAHPGGALHWAAPPRLGPALYALARSAGFRWQKGAKHWRAKDTPEARRFLKEQGCEIREIPAPPFSARPASTPLPQLTDFRITPDKRYLLLFIRDQGRYTHRRVDLREKGAGLLALHPSGLLTFSRGQRVSAPSERRPSGTVRKNYVGTFTARRDLAEAAAYLLWGKEMTLDCWQEPEPEDAQAAPLAEAAD